MCSDNISVTMPTSVNIKLKRANKPLMERRRRERINSCLNELKSLVLKAQKKDPSRFNKLEKADILEMTVKHVKSLHVSDQSKYESGFVKCAMEVQSFLKGIHGLPPDLMARVNSHINTTVPNLSPSQEEGIRSHSSFQSVCPITRLTESVPLASLENHKGCFTISKNVCEPVERTASNFMESASSTRGFIMATKSNTKIVQWCPPSPPQQEPISFISQFPDRTNSPSFTNMNWLTTQTQDDVQEAPLNLVVSSRSHSFPPSPPASISSSPGPYLGQSGLQIKTTLKSTFSNPEETKTTEREIVRPETWQQFSKASLEPSLIGPTMNPFNDPEALHWRPWFPSS